jgi:plastocyanin
MVSLRRISIPLGLAALLALVLSACGSGHEADLENGKRLYTGQLAQGQKKPTPQYTACSGCHALKRANATVSGPGPDLDAAFSQARQDGMTDRTFQGVVEDQIHHPRRGSIMPAGLVEGDDATDVAAYVASVAGQPGEDKGQLASIGGGCKGPPIAAKGTTLTIPACDVGTAFASAEATAPAGNVTVVMPNPSSLQHDIGIKGDGQGPVVGTGGKSQFTANLKPGKYEYFCSVPGHEAGGMKGTLTVK